MFAIPPIIKFGKKEHLEQLIKSNVFFNQIKIIGRMIQYSEEIVTKVKYQLILLLLQ